MSGRSGPWGIAEINRNSNLWITLRLAPCENRTRYPLRGSQLPSHHTNRAIKSISLLTGIVVHWTRDVTSMHIASTAGNFIVYQTDDVNYDSAQLLKRRSDIAAIPRAKLTTNAEQKYSSKQFTINYKQSHDAAACAEKPVWKKNERVLEHTRSLGKALNECWTRGLSSKVS
ncbi:hypothetical protein SFRURICE_009174 [Spodoptera frugiperda]|nr:hypothetical protein SFRURICE_009174 [Spodoptera frugiperda]